MTNKYAPFMASCTTSLFLCCLTLIYSCNGDRGKEKEEDTTSACPYKAIEKLIDTVNIQTAEQYQTLQLMGNVAYNPEKVYRYHPLLTGVVKATHFALGDFVQRGQVLLEIVSPEITEINASLREAETRLQTASRNLQAQLALYKDGVSSDRDVLEAKAELSNSQSEITKLRQSLQIYGGNIEHGQLVVKADISGYVVEKNVVNGQQIGSEESLFVLGNLDNVWVYANVYTGNLGHLQNGQTADITTTAWPGQVFKGKIDRLSNVFDPEERVLKGIIELKNPRGQLKPGMMVSISLHIDNKEEMAAVPLSAVIFDLDQYFVVRHLSSCQYAIQQIAPLYQDSDFYYIAKEEARPNEPLIGKNSLLVYNKLRGR